MSIFAATLADRIDALLPQTQCGQCGYHGCRPYAQAIAGGEAAINQCPPGGAAGINQLAALLGVPAPPLNRAHGIEKPRMLARIVESQCIGCAKCLQACPVDAIVGAAKLMHTVMADDCTGCELCIPACPVDCIELHPMPLAQVNDPAQRQAARAHFRRREDRLAREHAQREHTLAAYKSSIKADGHPALARAQAKLPGKPR